MAMPVITKTESDKIEMFLRKTFGTARINLKPRSNIKDSMEVYVDKDFIGTISKDEDDGETSFNFTMVVLDIDLED